MAPIVPPSILSRCRHQYSLESSCFLYTSLTDGLDGSQAYMSAIERVLSRVYQETLNASHISNSRLRVGVENKWGLNCAYLGALCVESTQRSIYFFRGTSRKENKRFAMATDSLKYVTGAKTREQRPSASACLVLSFVIWEYLCCPLETRHPAQGYRGNFRAFFHLTRIRG